MKKLLSITLSIIMLISAVFFIAPTTARAETLAQPTMRALRADELSPYVDATTALSHGHVARVPAEEDLNTIVYRNLDGTKTAYFFDYNVKYVDENGQTKDKDITLATKAGGFGLTQSDISLTIPTDITNGVEFTHNGNYIKLTPLRESVIEESLSSSAAALNKPQSAVKDTAKNEISYQKAFGNNTSLRYVPTMDGIKEEIILSSYTGTTAWRFLATTNGLTPYKDASGIYYFATAEDSDERYSLGEVYTYDSVGNYTYGTMDVVEVKPAQQYIITLNVDEAFLTADSTVYPVYVDPSLSITNTSIIDTAVYANIPAENYGYNLYMHLGYYTEGNTTYGTSRVVMRMQSLINNDIFYNYMDTIVSATLSLNFISVSSGKSVTIHRGTNTTWTETDAKWNTVGNAYNSSTLKTFTPVIGQNDIDIKSIVSSWKANETYLKGGILLKMATESSSNGYHMLSSTEDTPASKKPLLVIQYTTDFDKHFDRSIEVYKSATAQIRRSVLPGTTVTYQPQNPAIATVNTNGLVTGKSVGTTKIEIDVAYEGYTQTVECTVTVKDCPSYFQLLASQGLLATTEIERYSDNDEFFMMNVSIGDIVRRKGLTTNSVVINNSYIYCIDESSTETYGLIQFNTSNSSASGVAVSFIEYNILSIIDCDSDEDLSPLITKVNDALNSSNDYSYNLVHYFMDASSTGAYTIADVYINKVVEDTFTSNTFIVNETVNNMVCNFSYWGLPHSDLIGAVNQYNELARAYFSWGQNRYIYNTDATQRKISVQNRSALNDYEKNVILLTHTGNTSYQNFAAEIKLHADLVLGIEVEVGIRVNDDIFIPVYSVTDALNSHTVIANMTIGSYSPVSVTNPGTAVVSYFTGLITNQFINNAPDSTPYYLN